METLTENISIVDFIKQELIKQKEPDATILEIFKTGSQIFTDETHDLDYVVILDGYTQRRRKMLVQNSNGLVYDIIFIDKDAVYSQLDFDDDSYIPYSMKFYNYFFNLRENVYGSYQLDWNILEHKEKYLEYLTNHYKENHQSINNKLAFGKIFVHYYVPLKMFENNSTDITSDMLGDIRALYSKTEDALSVISWVMNTIDKE